MPAVTRGALVHEVALWVVAALIFALDITTPFGFVAPVLYVLLVYDSLEPLRAARPWQVATVCMLLTLAGGIWTPTPDIPQWAEILNRVIAVAVFWALVATPRRYRNVQSGEVGNDSEQVRALSRRLVNAEENERRGLTRELHDRVGQSLAVLNIVLNRLAIELPENVPTRTRLCVAESLQLVDATAESIENVMEDLRPPWLEEFGLFAALHWHADRFGERTRIATRLLGREPAPRLPREVEISLFRIAQEALTNIARHARTSDASIELRQDYGTVTLTVSDEGIGFERPPAMPNGADPGWGLLGMRERAQAIGATLRVESVPGTGTIVTAVVEHRA